MSPSEAPTKSSTRGLLARRAGEFLSRVEAGRNRDKRIAQKHECSRQMAQKLCSGEGWTLDRTWDVAAEHGAPFVHALFGDILSETTDRHFWFIDDGACVPAAAGHAEYVRRRLVHLPAHVEGDLALYAMRNLGWIAVTRVGDQAMVHCAANAIDPVVVSGVCRWLEARGNGVEAITRRVYVDGRWIVSEHQTVAAAIAALEGAAALAGSASLQSVVERLSLDKTPTPAMRALLTTCDDGAANELMSIAAKIGILDRCSMFRVSGDDVVSLWLGPAYDISPRWVGRNVMERDDLRYGEMLRSHMTQAANDPRGTLHRIVIPIEGRLRRYERIAIARPIDNRSSLVLTHSLDLDNPALNIGAAA